MISHLRYFAICIGLIGCTQPSLKKEPISNKLTETLHHKATSEHIPYEPKVEQPHKSKYHYQIIQDAAIGFGYDIFEGTHMKIHQPHIPVIPGLQGFKNANDAEKVAQKVIEKLDSGIMPPSLSKDEMIALGVL
jgi:hypothetical protein